MREAWCNKHHHVRCAETLDTERKTEGLSCTGNRRHEEMSQVIRGTAELERM